jgi:cobalt-zinc-cadmium efflux system protein
MPPREIGVAMAHGEHVKEVHDLHVWELAPGHPILTAHVLVSADADCHAVRRSLEDMLKHRFDIVHTTLQVDHVREQLLSIQRGGAPPHSSSSGPRPPSARRRRAGS